MDVNERLQGLLEFHGQMEGKNHFELLGVPEDVNDADVRKAYNGLIRKYNADFFQKIKDEESRKAINEVNSRLREAYNTLQKQATRETYLAELRGEVVSDDQNAKIDLADVFEADKVLNQSRGLMERGDFRMAMQKLNRAVELNPGDIEASVRLAYCEYMMMEIDDDGRRNPVAVGPIKKKLMDACEELPKADYLRVYIGNIEKLEGDEQTAMKWFQEALEINPDNITAKREDRMMKNAQAAARAAQKAAAAKSGGSYNKNNKKAQKEEEIDTSTFMGTLKYWWQKLNKPM